MKIIDILNKIANGEDLRFKMINDEEAEDDIFELENGHLRNSTSGKWLEMQINCDNWKSINRNFLNQEVEIIEEEKKIPENNFNYIYTCEDEYIMANFENIKTTLKDIIDYLQSKGDE